ncbi:MAG TPA: flagellar basal-body MS-ring/collar protein FliF [Bacteroidota bacterium]|nr:flagellar basal-body MS-ring/collar protein FliF [Bacteroidota bacterium]
MAEQRDQIKTQITGFVQRLTLRQKITIVGVTLAAVAAIAVIVSFASRPSYGMLFTNLSPADASKVVDKLKEKGIPYSLENEGRTILVPKSQMYELRLSLAGEGLPQTGVIGYEIFDRTNLGVSDFVQKVNYRRALEGELARTILQLDEVEGARVHIVFPEKTLFSEDAKKATASVVLKLGTGRPLKPEMVQGIVHLVAGSVEGLEPSNVTVLDSRGTLLSDNTRANTLASLTSTQYELQQRVENYLAEKGQRMLDGVLGGGNAIVQVNAELDFRQVERTLEQYDPDNTTVRSEQSTEEKNGASNGNRTNTITNYEINKTIEHIIENQGNIKRLSVAALINGTQKVTEKDGEKTVDYIPRPQQELAQLTDIIKRAVGYNSVRNDEISVVNLPFDNHAEKDDFVYREAPKWVEEVMIGAAILGALYLIFSLLRRFRVRYSEAMQTVMSDPGAAGGEGKGIVNQIISTSLDQRKRIAKYVNEQPDQAARLLKIWLTQN